MPRASDAELLAAFVENGPARIARLAAPGLADAVPAAYRAAALSVKRQASRDWTVAMRDGAGFHMSGPLREFQLGRSFGTQCGRLVDMLMGVRNPELRQIINSLGDENTAVVGIMSAFFHYFAAHEFLHIEQGLGSEQYADSDFYMPIVMEADYVADVAGLVLVMKAAVPELASLSEYQSMILLIAIHIASMQSFMPVDADRMDFFAFSRLVLWYLHFARFTKAGICPPLESPAFLRSWVVTFPRLLGRADQEVTTALLTAHAASPYAASSDIVLAYHSEDGLYRIHRAALTDADRVRRLCEAVLHGAFDLVRIEIEELLVNNPALVPTTSQNRPTDVEWAAGMVIDGLERLRSDLVAGRMALVSDALEVVRDDFLRLVSSVRSVGRLTDEAAEMVHACEAALAALARVAGGEPAEGGSASPSTLRRQVLSMVDQIAVAATVQPT